MVQLIKIYGNTEKDRVNEIINKNFENRDVDIIAGEEDHRYKFVINMDGEIETIDRIIYRDLVDAIEDVIINIYLEDIIKERIMKIYEGEKFQEENHVISRIKDEIRLSYIYIEEKIEIRRKLYDYLMENETIDIDGYIRFRLNEYLYIVDTAVDSIISGIKEERRLEDFVNMVQYFVDIQEPKIDYLNVILKNHDFTLKDMDNEIVGIEIIDKVKKEFRGELISRSDVLLSTLIIMSPRRIVVHSKKKDSPLIGAISEIFRDRFVFCSGCNMCESD